MLVLNIENMYIVCNTFQLIYQLKNINCVSHPVNVKNWPVALYCDNRGNLPYYLNNGLCIIMQAKTSCEKSSLSIVFGLILNIYSMLIVHTGNDICVRKKTTV